VQKEDLGFAETKSGYVYGGIQSRGTMTMDILGDTFLKGLRRNREILMKLRSLHSTEAQITDIEDLTIALACDCKTPKEVSLTAYGHSR
jgi:hypothetical protein